MFFVLLRPIFCEKWKIAPPIRKEPPLKRLNMRNWKKNRPEFWRRPFFFFFFFGDHLILGEKNVWILDFGRIFFWRSPDFGRKKRLNFGFRPKNHSEFWRRPFFFWRSPDFGRKNVWISKTFRLKFRTNRLKLIQGQWKFESRSFAHFSLFQNSPPPFSKSWLRACASAIASKIVVPQACVVIIAALVPSPLFANYQITLQCKSSNNAARKKRTKQSS